MLDLGTCFQTEFDGTIFSFPASGVFYLHYYNLNGDTANIEADLVHFTCAYRDYGKPYILGVFISLLCEVLVTRYIIEESEVKPDENSCNFDESRTVTVPGRARWSRTTFLGVLRRFWSARASSRDENCTN